MTRIFSGVVVLVGIALVVVTFANNLFAVGPAFDDLTDGFRPHMTDEAIGALQADLALLGEVPGEFQAIAPQLAGALGMDPAQLNEFIGQQFPDVATGLAALPEIVPNFTALIQTLDDQQENFAGADAIPTESLPATSVPWGLVVLGIVFVALGVMMYRSGGRRGAMPTFVVSVLVILGAIVFSLVGKAGNADDLNEALKPIYTAETVEGGFQSLGVVAAMGNQMQNEMLPALGQQMGLTAEEVGAFIGEASPTVGQALQSMPEALGRFQALLDDFDANLGNYDTLRPVSLSPVVWSLVIGSLIAALAAGGVLMGRRSKRTLSV